MLPDALIWLRRDSVHKQALTRRVLGFRRVLRCLSGGIGKESQQEHDVRSHVAALAEASPANLALSDGREPSRVWVLCVVVAFRQFSSWGWSTLA